MDVEGYLLEVATALDISGAVGRVPPRPSSGGPGGVPPPHLADEFAGAVTDQAARKPTTAARRLVDGGLAAKLAHHPLEDLAAVLTDDVTSAARPSSGGVNVRSPGEEVVMSGHHKTAGFTEAELAAMRARADELRASGRGGAKKADEAQACLDAIAGMPDGDRALAERVHALAGEAAPGLRPKTWYGMPAYVDEDAKVVCFFKPGSKFGAPTRRSASPTWRVSTTATLWPTDMRSPVCRPTSRRASRRWCGRRSRRSAEPTRDGAAQAQPVGFVSPGTKARLAPEKSR